MKKYFLILLTLVLVSCEGDTDTSKPIDRPKAEVSFVTTPHNIVEKMLDWCEPTQDDYIVDLGCGDGRIIITAAKKYGCKGRGYDIDPKLIAICKDRAKVEGVEDLVEFYEQDIFETELPKQATIVTMFLLPEMNLRLMPYLQTLADGVRVVSHHWEMPGVKPAKYEKVDNSNKNWPISNVYYFKTPMLVEANWMPEPKTAISIDFMKIKDVLKFTGEAEPAKE